MNVPKIETQTSIEATPSQAGSSDRKGGWRKVAVFCFTIGLVIPLIFYLGPFRLSAYRVVLLIAFIPALVGWMAGAAGRIRVADLLVLAHAFWAALALLSAHGSAGLEFAGMNLVETAGPYFLARCCIKKESDFRRFSTLWMLCIAAMIPFAVFENLTSTPILLSIFRNIGQVFPNVPMEMRWGLDRAQSAFEHPILFGTFCAGALGLNFYLAQGRFYYISRIIRSAPSAVGTFSSLSVGAFTGFFVQILLILWDFSTRRLRRRWAILGAILLFSYVVVDVLSNRNPIQVFITYLTFNQGNAYNRVLIWEYGTASVLRNPILGIGLSEWERAFWMSTSMDNFWLVFAVRYGLPGFALIAFAVIFIVWQIGRTDLEPQLASCRTGLLVTIGGLAMAGATVHYWNATYCLFMFLLGSGLWMLEEQSSAGTAPTNDQRTTEPRPLPTAELVPVRYRTKGDGQ